ncbi:MAG: SUMF1/EgtB/PvdO family nonheme iron enzyme [Bacteroidales bacterium]|jgi:gliding motility-associated lipoprotein GldJ|nr:SUMF1/EgtB/PvdO family nonheme iron enzyme [Bacteroidales bacterium]
MKVKAFTKVIFCLGIVALLFGCKGKNVSPTTGWKYDDPQWGGYESPRPPTHLDPNGMVFVEGGSYVMGQVTDNVRYDWDNQPRRASITSFYMDKCEISNHDYREYLYWLDRAYGNDYPEYCRKALPDTLVWRSKLGLVESMVENYFRSPNYADFPVVGVSWLQAVEYCNWRTDRVNERILIDAGFLQPDPDAQGDNTFNLDAYLAGLYEGIVDKELPDLNPNSAGVRKVRLEDGILNPRFRLPTEAEWEFAAYSLIGNSFDERVIERRIYPWNGYQVRTDDKKYYGEMLANFKRSRGDAMGVAGALNDHWDYTAPVTFYFPNDYGLFNMAGNVAEWCLDVYRPSTGQDADDMNPFRGNVYLTKVLDADGMISEKDSLGRISYREVTVAENINRTNYKQANNINYLDGDLRSQLTDQWKKDQSLEEEAAPSYEDEDQIEEAETNKMYQYGVTSMIDDKARVVKGGSWKDRAYYLSPGQRRFLDQSKSTDWIGFRCVMDQVGSREYSTR